MSASHAASAARKDSELATVRGRLAELDRRFLAEVERREQVKDERDEWERRARRERQGREEAATAAGEAVRLARTEALNVADQLRVDLNSARSAALKLDRQLADRRAQVETLAAYASGLEAQLASADEERLRSERDVRFVVIEAWHAERDLNSCEGREVEKEWRQRARADAREMDGLRSEVRLWEKEEEILGQWSDDTLAWEEAKDRAARAERSAAKKALQATEAE